MQKFLWNIDHSTFICVPWWPHGYSLQTVRLSVGKQGEAGGPARGETGWLLHLKVQLLCVCVPVPPVVQRAECWRAMRCVNVFWLGLPTVPGYVYGGGGWGVSRVGDGWKQRWLWREDWSRSDLRLIWTWSQTEGSSLWRHDASLPPSHFDDCNTVIHFRPGRF